MSRVDPPSSSAARRRVLWIDEHTGSRTVSCYGLIMRGHTCESVATALTALESIERFRPDVVVYEWSSRHGCELGLPSSLRARARNSLIIIAVSALDEPEGFREREGIDAYFTKPVLVQEVERVFESDLSPGAALAFGTSKR